MKKNTQKRSGRKQGAAKKSTARRPPTPAPWYDTRIRVAAPMPVLCPKCSCSRTAAANGVHYRNGQRIEHRICTRCGFVFATMRGMTAYELEERGLPVPEELKGT
jgi:hypothetical protein